MLSCVITTSFPGCPVTVSLLFRYAYSPDMTAAKLTGLVVAALVFGGYAAFVGHSFENVFGRAGCGLAGFVQNRHRRFTVGTGVDASFERSDGRRCVRGVRVCGLCTAN